MLHIWPMLSALAKFGILPAADIVFARFSCVFSFMKSSLFTFLLTHARLPNTGVHWGFRNCFLFLMSLESF